MATDDWETRKEFLRFTKEEEVALTALQPIMAQHVDELVGAFYRHLLSFPETRKFLTDELISTRLLKAQKRYLHSLVAGSYDRAYEEDRRRIGQIHAHLGLTPEWYLGAYALYLSLLQPLIFEQFRHQPAKYVALRIALTKVIYLDMQLALEAYIEKSSEGQEHAVKELAGFTRELEQGLNQSRRVLSETQERLRFTERLAELGTLAASMAHEIGTPLNVISGRAEQLMERTDDERMKKGLEIIAAQVERVTKLMNQLLTFARRGPPNFQPLDLRGVAKNCLDAVEERLSRQHIQVVSEHDEELPDIHGDGDLMTQVLLNLVLNAVQAMPEGGTLRVATAREGEQQIRVTVGDTGHGIPPDVLPKIFEPFVTTKERGQGTGLGLTVVLGIVQDHGGTIHGRQCARPGDHVHALLANSRIFLPGITLWRFGPLLPLRGDFLPRDNERFIQKALTSKRPNLGMKVVYSHYAWWFVLCTVTKVRTACPSSTHTRASVCWWFRTTPTCETCCAMSYASWNCRSSKRLTGMEPSKTPWTWSRTLS